MYLKENTHVAKDKTETPIPDVTKLSPEERQKGSEQAANKVNRRHGAGTIFKGMPPVVRTPTGLPCFDLLTRQFVDGKLVEYGMPQGQYLMFWGQSDVGKTSLIFQLISRLQQLMSVMFTDAEFKYDPVWAMQNGVDVDKLYMHRPTTMEEYLDIIIEMAGGIGINFIDSVVSVSSIGEMETKDGKQRTLQDDTIALAARQMSKFFRIATSRLAKAKTTTVFLNQIRTAGIGGYATYESFPGGNALKFYCHWICKVSRSKTTEKELPDYGLTPSHDVKLKVTKGLNEDKELTTTFFRECGFDALADLVRQMREFNLITKTGTRYQLHGKGETYFLKDIYGVVEESYDTWYKLLMETEKPLEGAADATDENTEDD
jgi:recombination protein RecA